MWVPCWKVAPAELQSAAAAETAVGGVITGLAVGQLLTAAAAAMPGLQSGAACGQAAAVNLLFTTALQLVPFCVSRCTLTVISVWIALAMPKSMSFSRPLTSTKFSGLRSLCTTSRSCTCWRILASPSSSTGRRRGRA